MLVYIANYTVISGSVSGYQWRAMCFSRVHVSREAVYTLNSRHIHANKNICMTYIQCWINVEDVGPMLYKCYTNDLCLLG